MSGIEWKGKKVALLGGGFGVVEATKTDEGIFEVKAEDGETKIIPMSGLAFDGETLVQTMTVDPNEARERTRAPDKKEEDGKGPAAEGGAPESEEVTSEASPEQEKPDCVYCRNTRTAYGFRGEFPCPVCAEEKGGWPGEGVKVPFHRVDCSDPLSKFAANLRRSRRSIATVEPRMVRKCSFVFTREPNGREQLVVWVEVRDVQDEVTLKISPDVLPYVVDQFREADPERFGEVFSGFDFRRFLTYSRIVARAEDPVSESPRGVRAGDKDVFFDPDSRTFQMEDSAGDLFYFEASAEVFPYLSEDENRPKV